MRIKRIAMPKQKNPDPCRARNLRWPVKIDAIAVDLAHEKRLKGGVSELLARLILAESKRKRGVAHLHNPADCSRSVATASPRSK